MATGLHVCNAISGAALAGGHGGGIRFGRDATAGPAAATPAVTWPWTNAYRAVRRPSLLQWFRRSQAVARATAPALHRFLHSQLHQVSTIVDVFADDPWAIHYGAGFV